MRITKKIDLYINGAAGVAAIISIRPSAATDLNKASYEQDAMFIHEALLDCLPYITYTTLAKYFAERYRAKKNKQEPT